MLGLFHKTLPVEIDDEFVLQVLQDSRQTQSHRFLLRLLRQLSSLNMIHPWHSEFLCLLRLLSSFAPLRETKI